MAGTYGMSDAAIDELIARGAYPYLCKHCHKRSVLSYELQTKLSITKMATCARNDWHSLCQKCFDESLKESPLVSPGVVEQCIHCQEQEALDDDRMARAWAKSVPSQQSSAPPPEPAKARDDFKEKPRVEDNPPAPKSKPKSKWTGWF